MLFSFNKKSIAASAAPTIDACFFFGSA